MTEPAPEKRFDEAFQIADTARERILAFLGNVSQGDSEGRPGEGTWSIGEIVHHLLLVEGRFCDRMAEQIETGEEGGFDSEEVLATRPCRLEDFTDIEKSGKGKAPESTQPSHGLPLEDLVGRLDRARKVTRERLLPYRARDLSGFWFTHSRLGPLNMYEQIGLIGYHELKHLAQMQRCAEALKGSG